MDGAGGNPVILFKNAIDVFSYLSTVDSINVNYNDVTRFNLGKLELFSGCVPLQNMMNLS